MVDLCGYQVDWHWGCWKVADLCVIASYLSSFLWHVLVSLAAYNECAHAKVRHFCSSWVDVKEVLKGSQTSMRRRPLACCSLYLFSPCAWESCCFFSAKDGVFWGGGLQHLKQVSCWSPWFYSNETVEFLDWRSLFVQPEVLSSIPNVACMWWAHKQMLRPQLAVGH